MTIWAESDGTIATFYCSDFYNYKRYLLHFSLDGITCYLEESSQGQWALENGKPGGIVVMRGMHRVYFKPGGFDRILLARRVIPGKPPENDLCSLGYNLSVDINPYL